MSSSTPSSEAPAGTAAPPRSPRRTTAAPAAAGMGTGATRTCSRRPWQLRALRSSPQVRDALFAALRVPWARSVGCRGLDPGRAVVGGWDRIGCAVVDFPLVVVQQLLCTFLIFACFH